MGGRTILRNLRWAVAAIFFLFYSRVSGRAPTTEHFFGSRRALRERLRVTRFRPVLIQAQVSSRTGRKLNCYVELWLPALGGVREKRGY
jgi:hypothetical protein